MTSSKVAGGYQRRIMWLAIAIVIAIAAYSAVWRYAAARLVDETQAAVTQLNRDGRRASCEAVRATGYPFRIGVNCDRVLYEDARAGLGIRTQGFRSAAQVYDWSRIVAELDSPAILEFPGVNALDVNWNLMQAGIRLDDPLPERVSVAAEGIAVAYDSRGSEDRGLFEVERGELHMRPSGRDLDLAVRASGLRPSAAEAETPPIGLVADMVLTDLAVRIADGQPISELAGRIRSVDLSVPGGAGLSVSGEFAVAPDGLLDADLEVIVRDPEELARIAGEAFPESRDDIAAILSGIVAMGDGAVLPLTVRRGEASLGIFRIGFVPPLI